MVISVQIVDDVVDIKKPRDKKVIHKRLKKRYQTVDSDEEIRSGQQNDINGSRAIQESESEDDIPISSIFNNKAVEENMMEEKANKKKIAENGDKTVEENGTHVIESKGKVDALVIDDEPKRSVQLLLYIYMCAYIRLKLHSRVYIHTYMHKANCIMESHYTV